MLGIGRPDRHPLLRFTSKEIAPTADACSPPASGFVLRRNPVVAARSGEGLFTIPFADLHQCKTVEFTTYALAEASTCLSLCSRGWRIDRDRYQVARAW
jgi:hypothetical protein